MTKFMVLVLMSCFLAACNRSSMPKAKNLNKSDIFIKQQLVDCNEKLATANNIAQSNAENAGKAEFCEKAYDDMSNIVRNLNEQINKIKKIRNCRNAKLSLKEFKKALDMFQLQISEKTSKCQK